MVDKISSVRWRCLFNVVEKSDQTLEVVMTVTTACEALFLALRLLVSVSLWRPEGRWAICFLDAAPHTCESFIETFSLVCMTGVVIA